MQLWLQRTAIWVVMGVFLSLVPITWQTAVMILILVFLAEYLATLDGIKQGVEAMISLSKTDLARLKDLSSKPTLTAAAEQELRSILQKGFERRQ